jgi:DNA-binding CsgD family transcriptional regulator
VARGYPSQRDRLRLFEKAFQADPRPGFLFEAGHLVDANAAARQLASDDARSGLIEDLRAAIASDAGSIPRTLGVGTHSFLLELHVIPGVGGLPLCLCLLLVRTPSRDSFLPLSDREAEVLKWLALGATNAEIAARLGISAETVKKHVSHAMKKTRAKTRAGLAGRLNTFD